MSKTNQQLSKNPIGCLGLPSLFVLLASCLLSLSAKGGAIVPVEPQIFPKPPVISSPLTLYDVLKTTLNLQPNIQLQEQTVNQGLGNYLVNKGLFDTNLDANLHFEDTRVPLLLSAQPFPGFNYTHTEYGEFSASLSKMYGNGVVIGPSVEISRLNTNLKQLRRRPIENRSRLDFSISIPLIKGSRVGLNAEAAFLNYEAELANVQFTVSQSILNSTEIYWRYVNEYQKMLVLKKAVRHDKKVLRSVKTLVEKEEVPRSDIDLAEANLAGRRTSYLGFQQRYMQAKRDLAVVMGYDTNKIHLLPDPGSPFARNRSLSESSKSIAKYMQTALNNRHDLKAARVNTEASLLLVQVRQTDLGPAINAAVRVGYDGLHEGTKLARAVSDNVVGPSVFADLSYQYPLQNNAAKGDLMQQSATYAQNLILWGDLWRNIKLNILLSLKNTRIFSKQRKTANRAVRYYTSTFENEIEKFKMGETSLLDALRTEDLLVANSLIKVDAESNYSQALVNFNFEQGLLVCSKQQDCSINMDAIT